MKVTESKIMYVDLDDTVKDTERYIRRVIESNCGSLLKGILSVYELMEYENMYIKEVLSHYDAIPYKDGAKNSLDLLSTEYEIEFCSCYTYAEEAESKLAYAKSMGKKIHLVSYSECPDKSCIDMSGGIIVDDKPYVLNASKADRKFELLNRYTYNVNDERDASIEVVNWYSLVDKLMGGVDSIDEDIRRYVCQGIQRYCQTCG